MQKVLVRDASPEEGHPQNIEMNALDANDAVAADPERYSIVHRHPVHAARSIEDRVTFLEGRVKALEDAGKVPAGPEPEGEE